MTDDYFGDFYIFVDGDLLTCLRGLTYGDALDWCWPIIRDNPLCDVEVRVCYDGD